MPISPAPPPPVSSPPDARPVAATLPQLFNQLIDDGELLVRGELRLAQAQLARRVRAAMPAVLALLLGSLFLLASLFMLLLAVIGWLTPRLGEGNAALVVTIATAIIGSFCVYIGFRRLDRQAKIDLPPSQDPHP